jgi:hypothetical protein
MRIGQVVLGIAVALFCLARFAPSQDERGAKDVNKACDELRRLLSELASDDRFTRVAAEKQLHECCELLSRTLVARASLTPDKTLLGHIEGRANAGRNKDEMDATPALAMRLLGDLSTTRGIRDRLQHIDYVATISAFAHGSEAGLEWLLVRPAAYSIFKLGRASTPEIIAYLSEKSADDVTQEQIDLLAKLLVYTHSDPRSALRIVRASLTTLPPYATAENLYRLDKALTARRDR